MTHSHKWYVRDVQATVNGKVTVYYVKLYCSVALNSRLYPNGCEKVKYTTVKSNTWFRRNFLAKVMHHPSVRR